MLSERARPSREPRPGAPGNTNALRGGVHSPRLIQARAAEIKAELEHSFAFSATQAVAVREVARCTAVLEAIDRELDERGLFAKGGKPSYLLPLRARISRQLEQWLAKIAPAIERQSDSELKPQAAGRADYLRELQRIALGHDPTASTRDRLTALTELLKLDSSAGKKAVGAVYNVYPDGDDTGQEVTGPSESEAAE